MYPHLVHSPAMLPELTEPAPCDSCPKSDLCRYTGSACASFSAFVKGENWTDARREPTLHRGKVLGLKAAEMTDADRERLLAGMVA